MFALQCERTDAYEDDYESVYTHIDNEIWSYLLRTYIYLHANE